MPLPNRTTNRATAPSLPPQPAKPEPVADDITVTVTAHRCGAADAARRQRIRPQTMADSSLIVSMPYCSVGFPVVSTAIR